MWDDGVEEDDAHTQVLGEGGLKEEEKDENKGSGELNKCGMMTAISSDFRVILRTNICFINYEIKKYTYSVAGIWTRVSGESRVT